VVREDVLLFAWYDKRRSKLMNVQEMVLSYFFVLFGCEKSEGRRLREDGMSVVYELRWRLFISAGCRRRCVGRSGIASRFWSVVACTSCVLRTPTFAWSISGDMTHDATGVAAILRAVGGAVFILSVTILLLAVAPSLAANQTHFSMFTAIKP
jgi:hypothetical protein